MRLLMTSEIVGMCEGEELEEVASDLWVAG